MQLETALLDKSGEDRSLYELTFNRPKALNSFNTRLVYDVISALDLVQADSEARVVLIRGQGNNFSAGADIKERPQNTSWDSAEGRCFSREYLEICDKMCDKVWEFPLPIIAEISGYCLGLGLVFALKCDIRVVAENAKLGFPEVKHGVFAAQGGTQFIPRFVGIGRAKFLAYTGRFIDGRTAYSMGMADLLAANDSEVASVSLQVAREIAENAPLPVKFTKWLMNKTFEVPANQGALLEKLKDREIETSEDWVEGFRAFAEKRKPHFNGK
jgi:enoyl-CoA hydratase